MNTKEAIEILQTRQKVNKTLKSAIGPERPIYWDAKDRAALSHLTKLAEENAALKATLKVELERSASYADACRTCKYEVENAALKAERDEAQAEMSNMGNDLAAALLDIADRDAELDAARPLLEAAMSKEEPLGPGVIFQAPSIRGHSIIEKADAYRERKGKEGKE